MHTILSYIYKTMYTLLMKMGIREVKRNVCRCITYSYGELNCDGLHILITFIYIITPLLTSTYKPGLARDPSSLKKSKPSWAGVFRIRIKLPDNAPFNNIKKSAITCFGCIFARLLGYCPIHDIHYQRHV